jgi:uncharacterized membrane-anchored protein
MFFYLRLQLKNGRAHFNTQRLYFFAAGNNASIVVAQHQHGPLLQVRGKNTLAGTVKIIAVH